MPVTKLESHLVKQAGRGKDRRAREERGEPLEGLFNHLLALLPERRGHGGIERILTYAFADGVDDHVVRYDVAHVAVLAVLAAHLVSGRDNAAPY